MIHGDFTKLRTKDWRDADVVFANSTCYDEGLMHKIAHLACKFIVLYTRIIVLLAFMFHQFSWNEKRCIFYNYDEAVALFGV